MNAKELKNRNAMMSILEDTLNPNHNIAGYHNWSYDKDVQWISVNENDKITDVVQSRLATAFYMINSQEDTVLRFGVTATGFQWSWKKSQRLGDESGVIIMFTGDLLQEWVDVLQSHDIKVGLI
jgi:hypothetical protein